MTTDLERRLRRDLGRLDEIDLPPFDPGAARAADVVTQTPRRSPLWLSIAAATLLVLGTVSVWLVRDHDDGPAKSGQEDLPTVPEPTDASGFADGLPLLFDVEPIDGSPLLHRQGATTVVLGDRMFVVGGTEDPEGETDGPLPVVSFDPATQEFRSHRSTPEAMAPFGQIVAATNDEILVVGGGYEQSSSDFKTVVDRTRDSYRYDPENDMWSEIAPIPDRAQSGDPWVVAGDRLLVWPLDGAPLAYDPDNDEWTLLPSPHSGVEPTPASVWTGTEWVIATRHSSDTDVGGVAYSPSSRSWRAISEKESSWRPATATWNGEEMIVTAGYTAPNVAAYNPASDTWRPLADRAQHPGFEGVAVDRYLVGTFKGTYVTLDPTAGELGHWTFKPEAIQRYAPYSDLVWTGVALIGVTGELPAMMRPITQPPCDDHPVDGARPKVAAWSDFIALSFGTFERGEVQNYTVEQLGPPIGEVCRRLNDTDADPDVHKVQVGEAGDLPKGTRIHVAPIGPPSEQVVAVLPDDTTVSYSAIDR